MVQTDFPLRYSPVSKWRAQPKFLWLEIKTPAESVIFSDSEQTLRAGTGAKYARWIKGNRRRIKAKLRPDAKCKNKS